MRCEHTHLHHGNTAAIILLYHLLTDRWNNQPTDWLTDRLTNPPAIQPMDLPSKQPTDWQTDGPLDRPINLLINRPTYLLTSRLTNWPTVTLVISLKTPFKPMQKTLHLKLNPKKVANHRPADSIYRSGE